MGHPHIATPLHIHGATLLADLALPGAAVVLDEIFNIPPPHLFPEADQPVTVADLAAASGLDAAVVITRIKAIIRMSTGIEIAPQDLLTLLMAADTADQPVLVDVREAWEFAICNLAGSLLLSSLDFAAWLPKLREAKHVVTICHHGVRSYSAAMYLRQHGVASAVSLIGGVDLWARQISPEMARY